LITLFIQLQLADFLFYLTEICARW